MRFKLLLLPAVALTVLLAGSGPAVADTVGEPGTPTCLGQRVSHGSSDHQLTPKERAAKLQELVDPRQDTLPGRAALVPDAAPVDR